MPIKNVTLEELSRLLLNKILKNKKKLAKDKIIAITVKVASGPGQWASYKWKNKKY